MAHDALTISAVDVVTAEVDGRRRYGFVRVRTEAGITGYGEPSPSASATTAAIVERQLRPLLMGRDAFQLERLWEAMYLATYKTRGQATSIAISGVDIALHWGKYYTPHDTSTAFGLAACLHLIASTPCCRYAQEYNFANARAYDTFFAEPLRVQDGHLTVPDRPGLGLELSDRFAELR